ncbi:MAG: type II toxin-antitoxin system Phd/YefM family antitoxin [Hyphomicrobiales bacterium]|nr:type II toxin-antitoxin system Phd/YefM family antitoxin [Hyphomicrobiales bacterium]MCP5370204.1 type II toxin-antitoxin system Phd/YefM family antitoxin [Hyphomicrobiales bacterium]
MRTMKAGEFKAKCLKVMDQVAESGEPVVITKNGVPVAQLVPVGDKPKSIVGALRHQVTIKGDIVSPVEADWEAAR